MANHKQVIIIGAGMAGLSAARRLAAANIPVVVLDKGRGPGGRMATRRAGEATFDHGAQFFSAKTSDFQYFVEAAAAQGVVKEWWPGISDTRHPRWVGTAGMNGVPKMMAKNMTLLSGKRVVRFQAQSEGWLVTLDDGSSLEGSALLITVPAPQALELLENSQIHLADQGLDGLRQIAYHPCLAVMATLDQPSGIPAPGGLQIADNAVSWLADNFQKGISKNPSVTIHASPEFSRIHLDGDLNEAGRLLLEAAAGYLQPASVLDWQIHRWRYSLAFQRHPSLFLQTETAFPLLFGGDGFGIGNVEGAYLSGLAMADQLAGR